MLVSSFLLALAAYASAIPSQAYPSYRPGGPAPPQHSECPTSVSDLSIDDPVLPDPFTTLGGQEVTDKAQWQCRQDELRSVFQQTEVGLKPGRPDKLTSVLVEDVLHISSTVANRTMTFNVTINAPNGTGPHPAVIVYGGASIPIPSATIATIVFDNSGMAQQNSASSRGLGQFYDLYGSNATASAMTAWAWGVSRIIDALELDPSAGIDPRRIGVTGCSRNGKGAFFAGALDRRVALTIPQESGSGGAACWRLSDYMLQVQNITTQTASEIVGENVWFSRAFEAYANYIPSLPVDHHLLAGLVAPRGLLVFENTDFVWLGPQSSLGCMTAGRTVYDALGARSSMGFSQVGNHSHCSFPAEQQLELTAFFDRFLLDEKVDTDVFRTTLNETFDAAKWAPWKTPRLV